MHKVNEFEFCLKMLGPKAVQFYLLFLIYFTNIIFGHAFILYSSLITVYRTKKNGKICPDKKIFFIFIYILSLLLTPLVAF